HPEAHEAVVGLLDALDELLRRLRRELRVDDVDHVALDVAESRERLLELRADLRRPAVDPVLHALLADRLELLLDVAPAREQVPARLRIARQVVDLLDEREVA